MNARLLGNCKVSLNLPGRVLPHSTAANICNPCSLTPSLLTYAITEARGGLHVVEQSLWAAVPAFLRRLSTALKKHTGRELPLNATPMKFGSWMGGDRDGNPNVNSKTTHHVVALGKWMAADLYLREVDILRFEVRAVGGRERGVKGIPHVVLLRVYGT